MFSDIIEILDRNGRSTAGYVKCAAAARESIGTDPDRAAGYLLLVTQAEQILERTDRMPVTAQQTVSAFEAMKRSAAILEEAYASGASDRILAALTSVSIDLAP